MLENLLDLHVKGELVLCGKGLRTLHNIHKIIGRIEGTINLQDNPISSHILGLCKIKDLKRAMLDNKEVEAIINKYLPEGDIIGCQQELIEDGFDEYAQL